MSQAESREPRGAAFPSLLLEPAGPGRPVPCDTAGVARIREVFRTEDLPGIQAEDGEILRLHDAAIVPVLGTYGLENHRRIYSRLIDPDALDLSVGPPALIEVASREDLDRAQRAGATGLVGRGSDVPGVSGEAGSFVLFQLLATRAAVPFWMTGPAGPLLVRAYRAGGASGVLIPAGAHQRLPGASSFRVPLPSGATFRVRRAVEPALLASAIEAAAEDTFAWLAASFAAGDWDPGAEDLWALGSARQATERLLALWRTTPPGAPGRNLFCEDTPYTRRWGTRLGVVQGPMSRVAVGPAFARSVYDGGAFPYLALAGMSLAEVDEACAGCAAAGIPYGVGIVAIGMTPADFEALVVLLERHRPDRVLAAAPQLDQIERLETAGFELFVHAPVAPIYGALRDLGVARFVLEGEDAGGHVSGEGCLALWEDVLALAALEPEDVTLVFAGGIASAAGAQLLSAMVHFAGVGERLEVAIQAGTAYLATTEIVASGQLSARFQAEVVDASETVVTGETAGLRVRQAATNPIRSLIATERHLYTARSRGKVEDLEARRRELEAGYLGSLERAVQGSPDSEGPASFMAGTGLALLDHAKDISELHHELTRDGLGTARSEVSDRAVAIIGLGGVLPGCPDVDAYFEGVLRQRCFLRDVPKRKWERDLFLSEDRDEPLTSYSGIAGLVGEIEFDSSAFKIPPSVADQMDRAQKLALVCAQEALADAGYDERPFDRTRTAVILGNSMGGDAADRSAEAVHLKRFEARLRQVAKKAGSSEVAEELLDAYFDRFGAGEVDADTLPGELSNVIAGRVAWAFDLHGENYTVDAACASTLAAVAQAMEALRSGRADLVLTGGVDTQTDPGTFVKFSKLTALSGHGSFPFDARGDGFVIGEGCGVFVLKRYADALRDGDQVYALLEGWGAASDGAGQGITAPSSENQVRAMRRAYQDAGADPRDLSYVECHGTGTLLGDATEIASLGRLRGPDAPVVPVGSAKAMVGHLKAAAGVAGLLRAVLAVNSGVVPPQVNFETPREDLDLESSRVRVASTVESLATEQPLVGVSSFGFGGTNFHAVLGAAEAGARAPRIHAGRFEPLPLKPVANDVAFLFPGQGSQYVGMIEELVGEAGVEAQTAEADAIFRDLRDEALSDFLYPAEPGDAADVALRDTAVAQPAIFLASALLLDQVRLQGVEPGMVIGHSLGEYSALYAAGVLSFEQALRTVSLRGLSMRTRAGEDAGAMAFVAAGESVAAEIVAAVEGYVVVANLNAYDQTVIAGDTPAVKAAVQIAMDRGVKAKTLNVSAAFHSALVADSAADMAAALAEAPLRTTSLPVPANLTGQLYPRSAQGDQPMEDGDRASTIELLTRQLAEPVDFISQIEQAYAAGVRRFVEVGPKDVLARLVRDILQGKPCQVVALDPRRVDPRTVIAKLPATLREPLTIGRRPLGGGAVPARRRAKATSETPATPEAAVREIIAAVSGYDPERIGLDQDLEQDLGIDTLKIFEIFSRLRRDVLPAQVHNFRDLTTVRKILTAVEAAGVAPAASSPGAAGVLAVRLTRAETPASTGVAAAWRLEPLGDAAPTLSDWIPRAPTAGPGLVLAACRPSLASLPGSFLPALRDALLAADGGAPVRVITSGPDGPHADAVRRSLAAFVRSASKDLRAVDLGYRDLQTPDAGSVAAALSVSGPVRILDATGKMWSPAFEVLDDDAPDDLGSLLTTEDLVLVTGGARGIAAALVRDLLDRCGARFLLLGRRPGGEDWVLAAGSDRVEYLQADVTDPVALGELGLAARGVTVLVHAAGIQDSRGLAKKDDATIARTWSVKVDGAQQVLDALGETKLRGTVYFSSVAEVYGNHGQADYAAANAALGALAEGPTLTFAWGPWDEVGMATRGDIPAVLAASGVAKLPVVEGCLAFRRGLHHLLATGETERRLVTADLGPGFVLPGDPKAEAVQATALVVGREEFEYRFDLEASRYLGDHQINGRHYLPAVSLIRQFLKRAATRGEIPGATFEDVRLLAPVVFDAGETHRFVVDARGEEYHLEAAAPGRELTPVASLRFRPEPADTSALAALRDRILAAGQDQDPTFAPEPRVGTAAEIYRTYFHGPAFQVLAGLDLLEGPVLRARVDLDPAKLESNPLAEYGRVPYLLEAVFHAAGLATLIHVDSPRYYIPAALRRCRADLPTCNLASAAEVVVEVLDVGGQKRFDAVVLDQDGAAILGVEGLVMARSSEEVGHRTAILPEATPLQLGGCQVLLLDPARADQVPDESFLSATELAEIQSAPTEGRRRARRAGKLAVKLLAAEVMRVAVRRRYSLADFEVLSGEGPVAVTFLGAKHLGGLLAGHHFSVSHSGDRVAGLASTAPAAVDLERLRPLASEAVASVFTAEEKVVVDRTLSAFAKDAKLSEMYSLALPLVSFTQKEAVLKATGLGLQGGMGRVASPGPVLSEPVHAQFDERQFKVLSVFDEAYVLSVAREEASP